MIKHASSTIRVHPCRLQKVREQNPSVDESIMVRSEGHNNDLELDNHSKVTESHVNEKQNHFEDVDDSDTDCGNDGFDNMNSASVDVNQESFDNNSNIVQENENLSQLEAVSMNNDDTSTLQSSEYLHDCHSRTKIKQFAEYRLKNSDEWKQVQIISRGGKASGKYESWYNFKDLDDDSLYPLDWNTIDKWKPKTQVEEIFLSTEEINDSDLLQAKLDELNKWKENKVYRSVPYTDQDCISVRWVNTVKFVNGKRVVKSRLVARGFEEKQGSLLTDSATCAKESLKILLTILASKKWQCQSIDIKSAFLQGKNIERDVYLRPPKEAGVDKNCVWKLNTCIYGLSDASRHWYLSVKDELIKLGVKCSKYDPVVFYWHHNGELHGIICTHVDDFLFGGTNEFILNVMNPIKQKFVIGSECHTVFKYIGLNVNQLSDHSILVDQATYIDSIQEIRKGKERKGEEGQSFD